MHHHLLLILTLLFVVFLLVMLAQRIKVAYPIFLVLAGLGISFIPGIPVLHLDPELIFLIFLPPLLYEAAWYTSWNDFWKWKRPIALLAFGLVFFTSTIIAYTSVSLIPGFTFIAGFRNTQTYNRLWEARQIWGAITNSSRTWGNYGERYG